MPPIADNLATRISAIVLAAFLALQVLILAVTLWPTDDEPSPLLGSSIAGQAVQIVEALDRSPSALRPVIVAALDDVRTSVRISRGFTAGAALREAPRLEALIARTTPGLAERPFRLEVRSVGPLRAWLRAQAGEARPRWRMQVGLRDGAVVVIEPRGAAVARGFLARGALIALGATLALVAGLIVAVRGTTRPVARLAAAARRFSTDLDAQDLPLQGARELRDLSAAFNEMQHKIRGLVEERTRVLAAVAHDLRTYLTRLRLRSEFIDDPDQRRRAEQDIGEMSQLLEDTLLFAVQASADRRPEAKLLDLGGEVQAFVALRRELGEAVELAGTAPQEAVQACCPPLALRRMLSNLVDNAIRYGGTARLSVARREGRAEIAVEDDGPGIPAEALARITEPFRRLEGSRARSTGGAGLGLAIVKALAESCGGGLDLRNRPEGGLLATVSLPLA